mgnify:CR=1 FL=1
MKNEKKFIKEENKLRMENDARLLADLIYFNYEHSNDKSININPIYKTLHDTVNYTRDEEEKIKKHAYIYLRVYYGLELK